MRDPPPCRRGRADILPRMSPRPTIVVIGGGFSGTAVTVHLLRRGLPVQVVLVNRYGPIGRGVAYGTRLEAHVLNVPAGGMSALEDDADHFLRWARDRDPSIDAGSFVSRQHYGQYLAHALEESERGASPHATLERVVGEVRDIAFRDDGLGLTFADGSRRDADQVVLALGNYSPKNPPVEGADFYETDRYVRDPWVRNALEVVREGESVLLLGTGLTMMDIALDLAGRGIAIPLRSVSRHGLLPHGHRPAAGVPADARPAGIDDPPHTIARMLRAVRVHAKMHSGDWREVIAALRPITPALWRRLNLAERARFLRHVRPYWDVHRHRAAPATASAIDRMIQDRSLQIRAARVTRYRTNAADVEVSLRPRGRDEAERIVVDRVVNCTGPSSDVERVGDLLLDALLASGRIAPDPLRLGIRVGDDHSVIDANGNPSDVLFLVGPLLKADFWEATAVPELRAHAARVSERLLPGGEGTAPA